MKIKDIVNNLIDTLEKQIEYEVFAKHKYETQEIYLKGKIEDVSKPNRYITAKKEAILDIKEAFKKYLKEK